VALALSNSLSTTGLWRTSVRVGAQGITRTLRALLDPGSARSCVLHRIAKENGWIATTKQMTRLETAGDGEAYGEHFHPLYVSVGGLTLRLAEPMAITLPNSGTDILLGCDFIANGQLHLDGPRGGGWFVPGDARCEVLVQTAHRDQRGNLSGAITVKYLP
jgi:hypothetical protein